MPLSKRWRSLTRKTVGRAPERYGIYELGQDGEVVSVEWGVLRSELKDALAYADGDQVRWEEAGSRDHAEEMAREHRDRLE